MTLVENADELLMSHSYVSRFIFPSVLLFLAASCTKSVTQFDTLDSSRIPQPLFSGQTQLTVSVSDPNANFTVSGSCDSRVDSLQFRLASFHEWDQASQFAVANVASVDCKGSGQFSFVLPSLNSLGIYNTTRAVRAQLEARAVTNVGLSSTSTLILEYTVSVPVQSNQFRLTQGGGKAASTSFSARARVTPVAVGGSPQSASFGLKSETR